jgi:hypothetical protein
VLQVIERRVAIPEAMGFGSSALGAIEITSGATDDGEIRPGHAGLGIEVGGPKEITFRCGEIAEAETRRAEIGQRHDLDVGSIAWPRQPDGAFQVWAFSDASTERLQDWNGLAASPQPH